MCADRLGCLSVPHWLMLGRPVMLLVEDRPEDTLLFEEALQAVGFEVDLRTAPDGRAAVEMVRAGVHTTQLPDMILLDLDLPQLDGYGVLAALKQDHRTRLVPVVVLSILATDEAVQRAYDLHANAYMVKPDHHADLVRLAEALKNYWFLTSRMPRSLRSAS